MKPTPPNEFRQRNLGAFSSSDDMGFNGVFRVPLKGFGHKIIADCIVSDGSDAPPDMPDINGWEHVSVKVWEFGNSRIPTWNEMCAVKDIFWNDDECVVQYHPAKKDYVNTHAHVLHLWRHREKSFPTPPIICV